MQGLLENKNKIKINYTSRDARRDIQHINAFM